jgi:hypothetical protein
MLSGVVTAIKRDVLAIRCCRLLKTGFDLV